MNALALPDDNDDVPLDLARRALAHMKATATDDDLPAQRMIRKYEKLIRQETRRQSGR